MKKTAIIFAVFAALTLNAQTFGTGGAASAQNSANGFTVTDLRSFLTNLENEIQTTLPFIAAFNNSFLFASTGASGLTVPNNSSAALTAGPVVVSVNNQNLTISRDALRELIVLQNDLQRVLANLNVLTSTGTNSTLSTPGSSIIPGSVPGSFTGAFGGLTNQFVSPLTNGFTSPLTGPTGLGSVK